MPHRFEELANALDELSLHYRLEGRDHIAHQYMKASKAIMEADFLPANPAELPNVGDSIRDDIAEFRAHGEIPRLEEKREKRPYLQPLCQVKGIGPQTAKNLYEEKSIVNGHDLLELIREGELEDVTGIGPATSRTIRRSATQMNFDQNS